MRKAKTIHVTVQNIKAGKRNNTKYCPVALAVREAFDGVEGWACNTVGYQPAGDPGGFVSAKMPRSVKRFINRFDNGWKVKPFAFRFMPY